MCIVSMITPTTTTGQEDGQFPSKYPWHAQPRDYGWPSLGQVPVQDLKELKEILERLDALDKKIGARDCRDEAKEKFFEELQALIDKYKETL